MVAVVNSTDGTALSPTPLTQTCLPNPGFQMQELPLHPAPDVLALQTARKKNFILIERHNSEEKQLNCSCSRLLVNVLNPE